MNAGHACSSSPPSGGASTTRAASRILHGGAKCRSCSGTEFILKLSRGSCCGCSGCTGGCRCLLDLLCRRRCCGCSRRGGCSLGRLEPGGGLLRRISERHARHGRRLRRGSRTPRRHRCRGWQCATTPTPQPADRRTTICGAVRIRREPPCTGWLRRSVGRSRCKCRFDGCCRRRDSRRCGRRRASRRRCWNWFWNGYRCWDRCWCWRWRGSRQQVRGRRNLLGTLALGVVV